MPPEEQTSSSNGRNGSWLEYARLVLSELSRLQEELDKTNSRLTTTREKDIPNILTEIATLKVKAAFWGAIAGAIFSGIVFAVASAIFK